jgi:hypothetical protein
MLWNDDDHDNSTYQWMDFHIVLNMVYRLDKKSVSFSCTEGRTDLTLFIRQA